MYNTTESGVTIDPRTKVLFVAIASVYTFLIMENIYEIVLLGVFLIFLMLGKKFISSLVIVAIYALALVLKYIGVDSNNYFYDIFIALVMNAKRVMPLVCAVVLLFSTTSSRRMIAGLYAMKCPRCITIPFCIMLRYFPSLANDVSQINSAMKLRGVRGMKWIAYFYMPLLVSATQTSDELTVASITRGIEDPCKKTSVDVVRFSYLDYIGIVAVIVNTVFMIISVV